MARCSRLEGETFSEKATSDLYSRGCVFVVDAKLCEQLFVIAQHLQLVLHHGADGELGVADALGVLDVIIAGGVDGSNDLGVLQVAHIELLILGVEQVVGEPEVHGFQQLAAVELVPHHVEVEGGGLFDQLHRVGALVVDPGGQKAVLAHLIAAAVGDGGVLQEKLCVRGQLFPFAGFTISGGRAIQ